MKIKTLLGPVHKRQNVSNEAIFVVERGVIPPPTRAKKVETPQ